jgi:hypothetical protein
VPGVADEAGVLGVGHRLHAEIEVVDMDAMNGPLVFLGVLGAHEEFAGGNEREFWGEVARHRAPRRIAHRAFSTTLAP